MLSELISGAELRGEAGSRTLEQAVNKASASIKVKNEMCLTALISGEVLDEV